MKIYVEKTPVIYIIPTLCLFYRWYNRGFSLNWLYYRILFDTTE